MMEVHSNTPFTHFMITSEAEENNSFDIGFRVVSFTCYIRAMDIDITGIKFNIKLTTYLNITQRWQGDFGVETCRALDDYILTVRAYGDGVVRDIGVLVESQELLFSVEGPWGMPGC